MSDSSPTSDGRGGEAAGRRPVGRLRAAIAGLLGRLAPRSAGPDGTFDMHSRSPMSDAELREAFRAASLTVTPAPLGRPARQDAAPVEFADSASPPSPREAPLANSSAAVGAVPAGHPASPAPAGSGWPSGLTGAPEIPAPGPSAIPGNVTSTADDFFGGLVRRVDPRR